MFYRDRRPTGTFTEDWFNLGVLVFYPHRDKCEFVGVSVKQRHLVSLLRSLVVELGSF